MTHPNVPAESSYDNLSLVLKRKAIFRLGGAFQSTRKKVKKYFFFIINKTIHLFSGLFRGSNNNNKERIGMYKIPLHIIFIIVKMIKAVWKNPESMKDGNF